MPGLVPGIHVLRPSSTGAEDVDGRVIGEAKATPSFRRLCPAMTIPSPVEKAPMSSAVSPLAPTHVPDMPAIAGVKLATAAAGIRYKNRTDVLLAVMDKGTTVAGVFTKSNCPSAPVEWCRAKLQRGRSSERPFAPAPVVH